MSDPVIDHLLARHDAIVGDLVALLRMPSVSADPAFAAGMADARRFLLDRLAAIGMENVQLLDGGGQAAVYGDWLHAPNDFFRVASIAEGLRAWPQLLRELGGCAPEDLRKPDQRRPAPF